MTPFAVASNASSVARAARPSRFIRIADQSFAATMPGANGYRAASVNRRRPGVEVPAPERTYPCESGSRAGKYRPGVDDRQSAGSASHRARRDGLSMHAGRLRERHATGDAQHHCDRGLPAAACGDRSFFYPVSV
ncbi:hypothetical protein C7S14_2431 [Burkholderia cepacia]|nr:hypothetical protein C7S14_2431 [Burkholderia cepacia]